MRLWNILSLIILGQVLSIWGQTDNLRVSGGFIDDKLSFPRKEEIKILLPNDPLPGYQPDQDGAFNIDCRAGDNEYLVFNPDPNMYFPRIVPYERNATTMLYLTLNAVKHHYLKIFNYTRVHFDYFVDNAQIVDSAENRAAVDVELNMKEIPDELIVAAVVEGFQTIVKKFKVGTDLNTSTMSIYDADLVPARACTPTDWEYAYQINVINNTKEEFAFSANQGFMERVGNHLNIKSTSPLENILISALNPCYKTIEKTVRLADRFSQYNIEVNEKDLVSVTSPVELLIINDSGSDLVLEFKPDVPIKNNRQESITFPIPICESEFEFLVPPRGYLAFSRVVQIVSENGKRTGIVHIGKKDLIQFPHPPPKPWNSQNTSLTFVDKIYTVTPQDNYFSARSGLTYFSNPDLSNALRQFGQFTAAYHHQIGVDFSISTTLNSYLTSPHYGFQLVWNRSRSQETNFVIAADLAYFYSSNEEWFEDYNMASTSFGLNTGYNVDLSPYSKFGLIWRPLFEFGDFKKYSNDQHIENVRFNPSLLLTFQTIYKEHEIFLVTGSVHEAFYASLLISILRKIDLSYSIEGIGLGTPPRTSLEIERVHKFGLGYRF